MRRTIILLLATLLFFVSSSPTVYAQDSGRPLPYYINNNLPFIDRECSPTNSGGDLDRFIRAIAAWEWRGQVPDPQGVNSAGSGAKGKYQYMDPTWRGVIASTGYEPAEQYASANLAPEEIQDAVAYLEYLEKAERYDNDYFDMAVSHFLPAAVGNDDLLDQTAPGANTETPREYANNLLRIMDGEEYQGASIDNVQLHYMDAPDIDQYIDTSALSQGSTSGNSSGGVSLTDLDIIEAGNIPREGRKVGASVYGGRTVNGEWVVTNEDQVENQTKPSYGHPIHPGGVIDDTGIGTANNPLNNTTSFAELGNGQALGGLTGPPDEPTAKLAITYKGKTIVAEKADIGAGGGDVDGHPRAVDLWWQTAQLLEFDEGTDVIEIHAVDPDTPVTPLDGTEEDLCATSGGELDELILGYAWPDYDRSKSVISQARDAYQDAVRDRGGTYIGGCNGVDCGGFVTLLMINSGFDTAYNHSGKGGPTGTQEAWLINNPDRYEVVSTGGNNTDELRQGDVAFRPGHTFIYAGVIDGFNEVIASSSLCQRVPMAGKESITDSRLSWYRVKTPGDSIGLRL